MTKQQWPYQLTLAKSGTRWIKKYRQQQFYFPIPEEIRGSRKKLEQHNRHVWKNQWLPKLAKLREDEDNREKDLIRERWSLRLDRQPGRLYVARQLNSKRMFLDELLGVLIDEYEIRQGTLLSEEERKAVFDAPQNHLHVFGFVESLDVPGKYELPEDRQRQADSVDSETTVEALIVRFIAEKKPEVGERRNKQLRGCLADLQQYVGGSIEFADISEQTLKDYRAHILARMSAGRFGDERGSDLLNSAKQFVRWCVGQSALVSLLEPAVASSIHGLLAARRILTIKKSIKAVKTSPIERIRAFLDSDQISNRNKLYALLAANCGMTPVDMVDLRHDEIVDGVLTRKRHKQKDAENVPTVSYPLWDWTLELLEKYPKTNTVYVIPKSESTIDGTFRNAKKKAGFEDISLGTIKKTSSTMLGEQFDNDLADFWLGHAPNGIGQRHYIAPSDEKLAEAVKWLETQYFPAETETTAQ